MYVCICRAVTENDIEDAVAAGANTLADLSRHLGVASGCGTCAGTAESMLPETRETRTIGPFLVADLRASAA